MKEFTSQTVLVPWDFSERSVDALEKALNLVDSPEHIEIVHVTPYPAVMEPGVVWGTVDEQSIQQNLIDYFRKNVDPSHADLKFVVLFGDPGSELVRHATDVDAGLIVISSHGHSGIKRFFLGSVAERVTRMASCPVLVLRKPHPED